MSREFSRRAFLQGAGAASLGGSRLLAARRAASPGWDSLEKHQAPGWFGDAKFGIYFHWGVYSVPAFDNEWYSRNLYIEGERANTFHKLVYGPPSQFGYKDSIPTFHGEQFNPEAWAELIRKAGAKYAGPVAEHADGFSMWNSKVNPWNAARMGPRRDVVGEMRRAIRNEGMRFIATLHHQWLWGWYPTLDPSFDTSDPKYAGLYGPPAPGSPFDYHKPWSTLPPPPQAFQDEWEAKAKEVVEGYRPSLLYFDSRLNIIDERHLTDLISYYYAQAERWNEEVTVTYKGKDLPWGVGILDVERGRLADTADYVWQTDDAIDWNSWCYVQNPHFKSAGRIVGELVDIVSKNGNLLLDITPTSWGVMPEPVVERLLAIGRWLEVNGEAIYATRPWKVFGEGPTRITPGAFGDRKTPNFTSHDIRFTTRGTTLYAIALGWPGDEAELVIQSLGTSAGHIRKGQITQVALLGSDAQLSWHQGDEGLRITLPSVKPGDFAYAFKILMS